MKTPDVDFSQSLTAFTSMGHQVVSVQRPKQGGKASSLNGLPPYTALDGNVEFLEAISLFPFDCPGLLIALDTKDQVLGALSYTDGDEELEDDAVRIISMGSLRSQEGIGSALVCALANLIDQRQLCVESTDAARGFYA